MSKRTSLLFIFITIFIIGIILIYNYISKKNTIIITPDNYIQILNYSHDNIDNYVGKKIILSGYVYILDEFS